VVREGEPNREAHAPRHGPGGQTPLAADALAVKLYVQVNSGSPGGANASAAARPWYNAALVPSHLATERPSSTEVNCYLVAGSVLQKTPPSGQPQYIDASVKKGQGYKLLGTWSITPN